VLPNCPDSTRLATYVRIGSGSAMLMVLVLLIGN
jgi:hypothetical protein